MTLRILATIAVALMIIIGLVQWLGQDDPAVHPLETAQIQREEPDLFGTQVNFHQLRDNGALHYRLSAKAITQFQRSQMTDLTVPHLHLRPLAQPPWDVYSRRGIINRKPDASGNDEEVVYLEDQVRMVQVHPARGTVTLRSDSMFLYPTRQYAQTDEDVTIDTSVGRTAASGMVADMKTGVMKLRSAPHQRVHTIVLPEQFKQS